jgi:transposase
MAKSYRPWAPLQPYLLPPSPLEWLPQDHLAFFVLDVVEQLDVGPIEDRIQSKDARGERPYSPRMLLALLLYGYCVGVFSSRRIARATYEDIAFRVLAGDSHPHFTTINQFRLDHIEAFRDLFVQGLKLCAKAGLVKLGHVSLDGTKILANASKHKAMSYKRMQEEEARLRSEVEALLARANEVDQQEDETFGVGRSGDELPEELRFREARLARIVSAKAELEREAAQVRAAQLRANAAGQKTRSEDLAVPERQRREAATRARNSEAQAKLFDSSDDDDPTAGGAEGGSTLPRHRVPAGADGKPRPEAQRNFTDPESRIMVQGGSFVQAYNAQIVVDGEAQVIVGQAVTNQPPDTQHLQPLLEQTRSTLGKTPEAFSADSGYYSDENVHYCERNGIDALISVGRATHGGQQTFAATAHPTPTRDLMVEKLRSEEGAARYRRRKVIAEPPFGQIKGARGFRRFSLRGLRKVRGEWSLVSLTHNMLKLFRQAPAAAQAA